MIERRLGGVGLALAATLACGIQSDPGPMRQIVEDSDTVCADVAASSLRYSIEVRVTGADGYWTNGDIRLLLEEEREVAAEQLVVTLTCGASEDAATPEIETPAEKGIVQVYFDGMVPFEMTCDLRMDHPSVTGGGSCLPWFVRVNAGISSRDAPDASVDVTVAEVEE